MENMKKNNKKGFTLAELLIVVAIIAVLVLIAIPVFTSSLNKSKAAADEANARSLYGQLTANYLSDGQAWATTDLTGTSGSFKVTYDGQTYVFSSVCTAVTVNATTAGVAPTVSITTNNTTYSFPATSTTGTAVATAKPQ
jgi:prepilin-type N-terminal cleavage/methylation domain-containing protein